jgi:hypothetical protein
MIYGFYVKNERKPALYVPASREIKLKLTEG